MIVTVVNGVRERQRQRGLAEWATQYGWTVVCRPAVDWVRRMPGCHPGEVTLALSGAIARRPVTIAEYQYTTYSFTPPHLTSTIRYEYVLTVVRLRHPGPTIAVILRSGWSKLLRALFDDRETTTRYEPFDKAYRVVADDARYVRSLLGSDLVADHVAGRLPDWSLQGNELLAFRKGTIGDPAGIIAQFAPLLQVADLVEAYLRR